MNTLLASTEYPGLMVPGDKRGNFSLILIDGAWRCAGREVARKWAGAGGKVYVAEFREGIPYPFNEDYPNCVGKVCHMDDILPTFGSGGRFVSTLSVRADASPA